MRILELRAENFKRLKAVDIRPSGNIVEVSGGNGEGKTSTLDAIWAALGGKDAVPAKPIRAGEEAAIITLALGDGEDVKIRVTRKFRPKEGVPYATDLIVESEEGARFNKPQNMLDTIVGALCFDPLAFTRMKGADQVKALRAFVSEVDFGVVDGLNKRDFEARTEVNRRAKEFRARADALPTVEGDLPTRVDVSALETQLGEAAGTNSRIAASKASREAAQRRLADLEAEIARLTAERTTLSEQLAGLPAIPEPVDVTDLQTRLAAGREANALNDKADQRRSLVASAEAAEEEAMTLTNAIEKRKEEAAKAVAAAKMPVAGLGFAEDEEGEPHVTLEGVPFEQASQAQKIRASVAIAAAMNPKLRVARIMDGSLLDAKSWAALEDYAQQADLQVWVETVDAKTSAAVHIEDGTSFSPVAERQLEDVGDVV